MVSSRLEPGVDPLAEAHRRGNILLVVRLGNIDLEAPNTPAMDAPVSGAAPKAGTAKPPTTGARMMPMDVKATANATSMAVKPAVMTPDMGGMSMDSKPGMASASSSGRSAASSSRPDVKVDASQANWWNVPDSTRK